MHEVLLTRGDVQGSPEEVRKMIMTQFNCVLVHPECHTFAGTQIGQAECVLQLLMFNGFHATAEWLKAMDVYFKGGLAFQALSKVYTVLNSGWEPVDIQSKTYDIPRKEWRY